MAKRNKDTAKLKAGITFMSFLSQMAAISEEKNAKKGIDNEALRLKEDQETKEWRYRGSIFGSGYESKERRESKESQVGSRIKLGATSAMITDGDLNNKKFWFTNFIIIRL